MNQPLLIKRISSFFKPAALVFTMVTLSLPALAQSTLSGKVTDEKGKPVRGASVYLDNTIDGATTDSTGLFSFTTEEKGAQTLVATEVAHENAGLPVTINGDLKDIVLKMKTAARNLDEVVVTAGSIEASDKGKTVLNSLDIVTTAGSQADVVKAIQTLPGTQQQGTQTGLFVRGGDASEAAFVVDGVIAQNAFFSTAPGVAARSRFGPFQFKGVAFSSGGYSARYGQALSSVLELNSNDLPDKSTINTGINMAGVYFSGAKLYKKTSLEGSAYYNNLTPFYGIAKSNVDFYAPPTGGGGSARFVHQPNKNGIIKALVNYSRFKSGTEVDNPGDGQVVNKLKFGVENENAYSIVSYKQMVKDKWQFYVAGAYSYNRDDIDWDTTGPVVKGKNVDDRMQLRAEAKRYITTRLSLLAGTEIQRFMYNQLFGAFQADFLETQSAGYLEADWTPIYWLAFKPGVRYEHSALLKENAISPRLAMAVKAGKNGQFSIASGIFYQTADPQYLLADKRPGFQRSVHYIANYQLMKNDRILRIEGYYKDYDELVYEQRSIGDTLVELDQNRRILRTVSNGGYGYATGAELFWRDRKSIKNADYWISYSYIDTRRLYKNYLAEVQPDFIATHNLNIVTKYFIPKWQTQINTTYSYASGRPYYKPGTPFLSETTNDYHNLSIAINYLTSIKKWFTVIYGGVDNVTNAKNVFGYRYSGGKEIPMRPALYRSVFVGVNFSLTAFDRDEL